MSASDSADESDIIIINTCGFIEDAKKESIEVIFDSLDYREKDSDKEFKVKIAAVGCFTQRYYSDIKKEIPELDFLYGNIDNKFISEMFKIFDIKYNSKESEFLRSPLIENIPFEYIKISDGCSNNCSYCAIPLIRGELKCFPADSILRDCKEALARGVKELNIIAQDTSAYNFGNYDLPKLLKEICLLEGDFWIRLLYCHPDHVTDEIIDTMAAEKKILPYIDIPFQHISEKILKSMNRSGNYNKYSLLIKKLRNKIPDIAIRTTVMVGYPGETEADFNELISFVKESKLDKLGCFTYSNEENTKAAKLSNQVDCDTAKKRYNEVMREQKKISTDILKNKIGKKIDVLIEERIDEQNFIGRSVYDAPEVDGVFYLTGVGLGVNNIVTVEVTDTIEYDLIGEI